MSSITEVYSRDPVTGHFRRRKISVVESPGLPWSQTVWGAEHQRDQSLLDLRHQDAMAAADRALREQLGAIARANRKAIADIQAGAISYPARLKQDRYFKAWSMLGQDPNEVPGTFGTLMRSLRQGPVGNQPEIPVEPVMGANQVRDLLNQRNISNRNIADSFSNDIANRFRSVGLGGNSSAAQSIRKNISNFALANELENEREFRLGLLAPNNNQILQRQVMRGDQALSRDREDAERLGSRIGFIGSLGSLIQ